MKNGILSNKYTLLCIFVLSAFAAVYFSLKSSTTGTIISILGSIASLYAIIEALIKVKSIEQQNKVIKDAVNNTICTFNKQEITENIKRHIEVISRIQYFIDYRNADAAIIKIEELREFMFSIKCNPTTSEEIKEKLIKHIRTLQQDTLVLKSKRNDEIFPKDANCKVLAKHFEILQETLMNYSQQIHYSK